MSLRTESKAEKDRQKQLQDKCQSLLIQMLRDEDNKYCVDCDAKGPRWASWNLGVFLCIRCAGIHRNLGVHISKVKSVNLDSWTPEQVVSLQQMGNSRARAVYEASLPDTWRRPQTDSSLETFIRAKYQHKRYIAKEWVPPPLPKVDWDKELDEEAERQKKKKKEKQGVTALPPVKKTTPNSAVRVPALPKPTSSPKSSRASSTATPDDTKQSSAVDLLGLSTAAPVAAAAVAATTTTSTNGSSDDVFSSFLSAPPAQAPAPPALAAPIAPEVGEATKGRTAEEDSFFNQAVPGSEPKKPLSKDSILALYSSQAAAPPQPTMFHTPGMFPATQTMGFTASGAPGFPAPNTGAFPAPTAGGFPAVPPGGFPAPSPFVNGMPGHVAAAIPAAGANPFFGMSMSMIPPQAFPVQHGSNGAKPSDDLLGDFSAGIPVASNLPQQMAGLSLGQPLAGSVAPNFSAMAGAAFPAMAPNFVNPAPQPSMGQTFTTHLWQ